MTALIAILIGLGAISAQTPAPDAAFAQGAIERSVPVVIDVFVGVTWVCSPEDEGYDSQTLTAADNEALRAIAQSGSTEEDLCYAGVDLTTGLPITGP